MSEERNQIRQEQSSNLANFASSGNWEAQLQARANELIAQRVAPLKAEIERLHANISEISSRLIEQESGAEVDSSGLLDYVKQWFHDSTAKAEEDFNSRLEEARAEAAAAAREEAREESEKEFQSRIEQACADAAAVARRESDAQMEDLREQLEASRKALTLTVASAQQAPAQTVSFDAFKTAIEDIDSQRTQSETLSALVRRVAQFAPRVAFFVIKSGDAVGWKASGFENGLNDETVKLLTVSSQKRTLLSDALASFRTATGDPQAGGDDSSVLGLYSSPVPERAIAIPLIVFNKAAAVLYADSGAQSEGSINTAAAESLMRIAGRTIELLLSRRGIDTVRPANTQLPAQTQESAVAPAPRPAEAPAQQAAVHTESAPDSARVQPEAQPEPVSTTHGIQPESEVRSEFPETAPQTHQSVEQIQEAEQTESADAAPEELDEQKHRTEELPPLPEPAAEPTNFAEERLRQTRPSAQLDEPRRVTKEVPEAPADAFDGAPPLEPAPMQSIFAQQRAGDTPSSMAPTMPMSDFNPPSIEDRSSTPDMSAFQPPPPPAFAPPVEAPRPAQPISAVPTPGSETEQRAHNDARRFARLLVSEIKLYNAAKVNDGRRNYDLYDRLKDEIDRSRKVYDKRVSPAVAARFDYFYDELVQTLAEGDPAKLGKNCPGPVVLA